MCAAADFFARMSVLNHRAQFSLVLPLFRPLELDAVMEGKEFGFYLLLSCLIPRCMVKKCQL